MKNKTERSEFHEFNTGEGFHTGGAHDPDPEALGLDWFEDGPNDDFDDDDDEDEYDFDDDDEDEDA